jgi:predicted CXXCH cytochrome family protein
MESYKMLKAKKKNRQRIWLAFGLFFGISLLFGTIFGLAKPADAAQATSTPPVQTSGSYSGPETCKQCHEEIYNTWSTTRHSQAFSSPIFQRDWAKETDKAACLACHTTGYNETDHTYAHEGITCESCHGPFQTGHPQSLMPVKPNADLCASCHKTTTDEWRASKHASADIQCQACHNPHSQAPRAATVTELCTNCHKTMSDTFAHSTHANAGLQCSNCHMYTPPRSGDPIMGLAATGHTFSVGSDACIGCHKDTVHTRDTIVKLSGEVAAAPAPDTTSLEKTISDQEATIEQLKSKSTVRLYTGLAQGAIVGLVAGGVAAWVVSKRIRIVEEDEDE